MGLIKLALRSLRTDLLKSLFYFLSFVLTTIFIFLFFNLAYNPNLGIQLGGKDNTIVTPIAVFVILIAMVCVFIANDYYVLAKTKDISIILMSGASVYQVGIYLFLQSFIIMALAIPLGFIISYLSVPVLNKILFMAFDYQGSWAYISNNTLVATTIILVCEIGWCTLLNMGFCYRTSINKLVTSNMEIEKFGKRRLSNLVSVILFVLPMLVFIFLEDPGGFLVFSIIGMIGVYGMFKYVIVAYLEKKQSNEALEHRYLLIVLGNLKYDLKKTSFLVLVITTAAIILTTTTIYSLDTPLISMVSLMSYVSVMVLLAITSIFKIGMELQKRKKNLLNLYHLGYQIKELKKIITLEMIIYYSIIMVIPLMYQIIMMIKLDYLGLITPYLIVIILLIQITAMLCGMIICTIMYQKILPTC